MKNVNQYTSFAITWKKGLIISLFFLFNTVVGNTNTCISLDRGIGKIDRVTGYSQDVFFPKIGYPASQDLPHYKISFIFKMRMMLIETTIDDEKGYLVLDTGMENAIFNEHYFKGQSSNAKITGVNAIVHNLPTTTVKLRLGNLPIHYISGGLLDINLLEQHLQSKVLGICGIAFLKEYQWVIDYKKQLIFLYPIDKNGELLETSISTPTQTIRLGKINHLLYVEARVGNNQVKLGLDTGASNTLLTHKNIESLAAYLTPSNTSKTITIIGICGSKKVTDQYKLPQLMISDKVVINTKVLSGSLNRINKGSKIKLDGIFNPISLDHHVIGLNWEKQQLYVWSKWDWPGTEALVNIN